MSDKSKRCVLFMTFRPSQRTLFMARRNLVALALRYVYSKFRRFFFLKSYSMQDFFLNI